MLSTNIVPNSDSHGRGFSADADGPPTLAVPVSPPPVVAYAQPLAPFVTPPPVSDLKLSCSVWSADDEDAPPAARRHPKIGDTVLGFKLVHVLGCGAFARVYLAHEQVLAARQVALKVSLRPTREAQRLARLQHTNVVPVYSVHDDEKNGMQVICMPFLGRSTLATLVNAYRIVHSSRAGGRKSTSARAARTTAVDSKNKESKVADSKGGVSSPRNPVWTWTAEEPPPIVGDPHAVLQVIRQLAAGLAHAHERGILHLDLKPANVLLADTGEPMLLDFNLSSDATQPDRERVGGTLPYMAIEQLHDMRNRGKGAIDARTDLFALGVVAYELLTGEVPFPVSSLDVRDMDAQIAARRAGPPALLERCPGVTPAVEAIVLKLLAPEPADRYQRADDVSEDVCRHLNDMPLKFARARSARERFGKWRRRNPRLAGRALLAGAVLLAGGFGVLAQQRHAVNAALVATERAKAARTDLDTIRLDLVLPDDPKARARGTKLATERLAAYGLPGDANWHKRADVRRLSEADRAVLSADLGELMILLARATWQEAERWTEEERGVLAVEAWKLATAARGCFAAGAAPPALDRLAALIAPAAGETFDPPAAGEREPDARALFLDGAFALNQGHYVSAARVLDRAVTAKPGHAAAQFCLAYCRQQTGQFQRALERYDVARAQLPTDPRPAYQRAVVYVLQLQHDRAEAEFTKAIALDPTGFNACRHRALARFHLGTKEDLAGAEADLTAALDRGAPALSVHLIRGMVRSARGDRPGSADDADAAKKLEAKTDADFIARGWTRTGTDPKGARADFERALELNPRSLLALQNLAHVLADKLKDNETALVVATKVVELYPESGLAVANRAVILARLGRRNEARDEIAKARQLSAADPEVTYQAASVFALASAVPATGQGGAFDLLTLAVTSTNRAADQARALDLLLKAVNQGYRNAHRMGTDADLNAVRHTREYQDIQRAAVTLAKRVPID